jgi:hypothetical protein
VFKRVQDIYLMLKLYAERNHNNDPNYSIDNGVTATYSSCNKPSCYILAVLFINYVMIDVISYITYMSLCMYTSSVHFYCHS